MIAFFGATLWSPSAALGAAGDIGYEGPSSQNAGTSPTGSKPESKLWWNDGYWWASMWDVISKDFHIFRLNPGTQVWTNTGVALDDRASTRADVLWDSAAKKLYVASHRFSESPATGYPSRLYRYSYDAVTHAYRRDTGFPVSINNYRLETLALDKDSTGRLWATWVQGGKVWVNATVCSPTCDDKVWGSAFAISATSVSADDISSLIAFGGNRIGVMWTDQNLDVDYFAIHNDGDADTAWAAAEAALSGPNMADDHINLKSTADGRVFAAVKTSRTGTNDPLNLLLERAPDGTWSSHLFGRVQDGLTRPIVEIDEENGVIHMFASSSATGGSIMEKDSPLSSISFAAGKGTEVIKDADGIVNDATSTKQNVSSATGLVVAAHSNKRVYFHAYDSLNSGLPSPPVASFTAAPSSGSAPLAVQFTDASSGTIDTWAWDFETDGTIDATTANPSFTYDAANTYTATLTVANAGGTSSATRTITVTPPTSTVSFGPTDDAYVRSAYPTQTSGAATTLRVYVTSTTFTESYLRFAVSGVTGPVISAKLRLFVTDASPVSGSLYSVPETPWTESTITWSNKPTVGALVAGSQVATLGAWVEFDVTGVVSGDGTYSFALKDGSSNTAWYSSKEGADDPQLLLAIATP